MSEFVENLKVDERSLDVFLEQGLTPFEYEKGGKILRMSYYMAPESIFDDPEQAREWAVLAFDAALKAKKPARQSRARKK